MASSEKKSDLSAKYALIQGFYWMSFAAIMGFTSLYLLNTGFSNTQIGILMAVAGAVSAVLQPMVASYADSPGSPSLKNLLEYWRLLLRLWERL